MKKNKIEDKKKKEKLIIDEALNSDDMKKKKINLKIISRIAFYLTIILLVGGSGYVLGKYKVSKISDFANGVASELSNEKSVQTIERSQPKDKDVDMDIFWQVWDQIEYNFLFEENIDYTKMVEGATVGLASSLGDPYTSYFPPQENKTWTENLNGKFFGVGIQLGYKLDNQLSVVAPLEGMPGEQAGIEAGDFILKIVDEGKGVDTDTYGMSLQEAVEIIRGEEGTVVKLTLLHDGENDPYEVEITRQEIITPSVTVKFGQFIDGNFAMDDEATVSGGMVAYLRLSKFGELTDDQWDESIDKIINRDDIEGVVLDVRNNPGGLVTAAVNLAAEFLPRGLVVVKQEQRGAADKDYNTQRFGRLLDMPLVVLANKGSASASEIISGALRDHNRAKIVGDTTFGKGTMQSQIDIYKSGGGNLHLTTARWLTPNGTWVHEKGLEPDVKVEFDKDKPVDVQLEKAIRMIEDGSWEIK